MNIEGKGQMHGSGPVLAIEDGDIHEAFSYNDVY